jgi:ParB/RepB/Spo0J family partition protein
MTSTNTQEGFREIPVGALVFSASSAQAERRKHFDDAMLKELVDSVATTGILQPIVVRPNGKFGTFEVVAGERRVIAARKAKLETVPAMVRALDDNQALDIQLIENLQREGLHELVECEGYEDLRKRGFSVQQIADKVGKSQSYVYKRLELSACGPDVRAAFYDGKIDASKALLLSRLKDNADQKKALKEITQDTWHGPMSFRQAFNWITDNYLRRLDQAPFKTEDLSLVPEAGPCSTCPKNTSSKTGLFGDVSKEAICTDGKCFQAKTAATTALRIRIAEAQQQPVLRGKEAKKAITSSNDFSRADGHCPEDSQYRPWSKLLGKDMAKVTTVAVDPDSGRAVELIDKTAAKKLLKAKGVKLRAESTSSSPKRSQAEIEKEKAQREKDDAEHKFLVAVAAAIYAKPQKPFTDDELEKIAEAVADRFSYGSSDALSGITGSAQDPTFSKLDASGLLRYIRAAILAEHIDEGDRKVILDEAKRHGVNVEKVKAELVPKDAATSAPKKAAKKK